MYDRTHRRPTLRTLVLLALGALLVLPGDLQAAPATITNPGTLIRKIASSNEQLEITTNSSRILTLGKKIPRVQVNNPELLSVTPLSATQVQISAKKAGVTQVNLWDEDDQIYTVDVFIYGDVRELENALKTQFPNSSIRVYRYSNSLVLTGFIDRPDYVDPIRELAEDYAPKVINNISVGGVQQILLKVKVYEVSRTHLRQLGVDWAQVSSSGAYAVNGVSGVVTSVTSTGGATTITDAANATFEFGVTNGNNQLFGYLNALNQKNLVKVLAEPNIVAISGRPAQFNEGGELPIIVPQSLGNVSIEYKPYGTQIDFLPIVLGNGKVRLEVRPRISEVDESRSITLNGTEVPALTVRQVDTAVEMRAGQTLAIAGLIQQRSNALHRGLPFFSDIPILGVPFRRVSEESNEIELLILVTPEFVDALEPHEVPPCGPGMGTMSPSDEQLYLNGNIEAPNYCNQCGPNGCYDNCCNNRMGGGMGNCGADGCGVGGPPNGNYPVMGYPNGAHPNGAYQSGTPQMAPGYESHGPVEVINPYKEAPVESSLMPGEAIQTPAAAINGPNAANQQPVTPLASEAESSAGDAPQGPSLGVVAPGAAYSTARRPQFSRPAANAYGDVDGSGSGLIGPVGYDDN
ncbi:Type II secretion system protein D precursor [Pseudobythopirellula maris]|uniref:Type II secretion system protein D n=1 Tax=Pseudobythopirellula maris TaxID=2527991 RepID=A0A5C5ZUJ5_9BACT|nr:type II and III secretion system protein family protein [Pseudobythopirellula maris]TWT90667.1 Type II secretion system protein D precursor [Pseudobythopirellula maris]